MLYYLSVTVQEDYVANISNNNEVAHSCNANILISSCWVLDGLNLACRLIDDIEINISVNKGNQLIIIQFLNLVNIFSS